MLEIGKLYQIKNLSGFWLVNDHEVKHRHEPKIGTIILCIDVDKEEGPIFYFNNNSWVVSVKLIIHPNSFLEEVVLDE